MTSLRVAGLCFDTFSGVLDGVVVNVDSFDAAFDGVPGFLFGFDGVVEVILETVADFDWSSFVFVSTSVVKFTRVLSRGSSTLLQRCCLDKVQSAVRLAKLLARFRRVRDGCCPAVCNEVFGKVFGVEDCSRDRVTGLERFGSLRGDNGTLCSRTEDEAGSVTFFVLFDGDDDSSFSVSLLMSWFSSKTFKYNK